MSIEHNARIERASYLTHADRTEIVISLPGEHDIVRGEIIVLTVSEGGKK